ncbi:MAG: hypothetical protein LM580_00115 [Thermofilum sp.]|nr:hypothetical protein [Thermofilum sp.]
MLERSVVHKRAREPRAPFCPRCGMPWKNIGSRFVCPNCGYVKLAPAGKREVDEKLRAALERLLAEQHGTAIAVTLRKLARLAKLSELEYRYAAYRWRKILPSLVEAGGGWWERAWIESDRKRTIYRRIPSGVVA